MDEVKRGQVVKDIYDNHYIILAILNDDRVRVEAVATREVFIVPASELAPSDRVAF